MAQHIAKLNYEELPLGRFNLDWGTGRVWVRCVVPLGDAAPRVTVVRPVAGACNCRPLSRSSTAKLITWGTTPSGYVHAADVSTRDVR